MKLKAEHRLGRPVRIGWRCRDGGYATRDILGTGAVGTEDGAVYFAFSGWRRISSEEEARLTAAAEGIPFLDVTDANRTDWLSEDSEISAFVVRHNPEARA